MSDTPASICAFVTDLMDRSRVGNAVPGVKFVTSEAECAQADVVIIDLARAADRVATVRKAVPAARIVCFGPHVDEVSAQRAQDDGADAVLPRSRFFRDPAAAIG